MKLRLFFMMVAKCMRNAKLPVKIEFGECWSHHICQYKTWPGNRVWAAIIHKTLRKDNHEQSRTIL